MGAKVLVRKKFQITIPASVRRQISTKLEIGDVIELEVDGNSIIIRPKKTIDPDQAWFWTKEWQDGERKADADIEAGRVQSFDDIKDTMTWLDKIKESAVEN